MDEPLRAPNIRRGISVKEMKWGVGVQEHLEEEEGMKVENQG